MEDGKALISHPALKAFPQLQEGLRKALLLFERIKSFEDVETYLLQGQGLSPHTYASYMTAVKQLYEFTDGLNPLQVRAGHIEKLFDHLKQKCSKNTAVLRMAGLKKFFWGVEQMCPGYQSPFKSMPDKLLKKLSRGRGPRKQKALTRAELKRLLAWMQEHDTVRGMRDYAIVYFLATSGLRNAELCGLTWGDLEVIEGTWYATFVGKGDKGAHQELYEPAVEAARAYFQAQFNREPNLDDHLFYTVPKIKVPVQPVYALELCTVIQAVGKLAREQGIIKRELHWSPHLMRRTYATCLYKSGMKVVALQGKTRHADIGTLVKHYVDDDEPARAYLERMFA